MILYLILYFETSNACYDNIILQNSVLYYVAVSKLIKIENSVTNQVSINSIYKSSYKVNLMRWRYLLYLQY